jgi:DNA-binding response OmpR family regulator
MSMSAKVLIIDDSRTIVSIVRVYLTGQGYRFFEANNGATGLEVALREQPEVIISDVLMSPMDGLELCRQVRASPWLARSGLILMSGTRDEADQARVRKSGCDGFIAKPIDGDRLLAEVARVIKLRSGDAQ